MSEIKIEELELLKAPEGFKIEVHPHEFLVISSTDVDRLISTMFGVKYDCVYAEVWNDDLHHIQVDGVLHDFGSANYALESIEITLKKKRTHKFFTGQYLNFLAIKGVIPKGEYLVQVETKN